MAVNGTVVGEALPVSIPSEVQGVLVATLGGHCLAPSDAKEHS